VFLWQNLTELILVGTAVRSWTY